MSDSGFGAEALSAGTTVLFLGLIWLRARMQYLRRGSGLALQRAGRLYFAAAALLLAAGWILAPPIGALSGSAALANATVARVLCCLVIYYVFVLVHRILAARHVQLFTILERR